MQENQEKKQDTSINKPSLQSIYPTATNNFLTESIVEQPIVEPPKKGIKKSSYLGWYSVASFVSALIPIAIWAYCLIQYYSSMSYATFSFAIPIAYYFSIGLPIAAFSIGTGVRGLKSRLHTLASSSLCLKLCTALFVLCIL